MTREETLSFLNSELNKNLPPNTIDQEMLLTLRNYISHKRGKPVPVQKVADSLNQSRADSAMTAIDIMIQNLKKEFSIISVIKDGKILKYV